MNDSEHKEAVVRAAMSGLVFDLEKGMGRFTVIDRRETLGLPGALQPMVDATLDSIVDLFNIKL